MVQAALLTLVGLLLAFTLAMAVTRYEARRAAVVDDSERDRDGVPPSPDAARADALGLAAAAIRTYADASIAALQLGPRAATAPKRAIARGIADPAASSGASPASRSRARPVDSAPRLYVESLNVMIDMQTTRVAALNNRVSVGDLARRPHRRRGRARR